ncbi:NAD-glutamate dehydrogenase domain-containing protein [Erythrobacter crassostreae]|uniref:NAD-glutamate dehydrogenase n=1 Tax=Erythrobacter crassostreae TaxID=2828328 RepID=A0A9X1F4M3_9SPHN|nr:NAD-glutamate dehydrogenase domain-containing protein [Erythrobacter crassostrea]MBV7258710.1 NAD-glutamate dehydrogenase [Erythrobacter crassostrea]
MVSKPTEKSAKQTVANKALKSSLKKHLKASILPGDTPLEGELLDEAAEFVLGAAAQREPQRSSLRLESASGERRKMRIAIINDDMPFLVDSIAATIAAQSLSIDRLVHPVLGAERSETGELIRLSGSKSDDLPAESLIYIETPRVDARHRRELEQALRVTLGDVRAAVTDWPKMQAIMAEDAEQIADSESRELVEWLNSGLLTQLGHVKRTRDGKQTDARGICRKSTRDILAEPSIERAFDWFDDCDARNDRHDLLVIKANRLSHVHRRIPLDLFIVGLRDAKNGKVHTLSIHAGIWTSAAVATPPTQVPVLRTDLEAIAQKLGFAAGGHAGKALIHAFTALPNDLLIGFTQDSIARLATTMMGLVDRPRPRLALVTSRLERHIYAFVWQPRDTVSTQVRLQIEDMFTRHEGTAVLDWSLEVEGGTLAMLQFVIDIRDAKQIPDEAKLEPMFQDMLRGWGEAVEKNLADGMDPSRAAALASRYADAMPMNYRGRYDAAEAARDIIGLRGLTSDHDHERGVRLYCIGKDPAHRLRLKVYQQQGALPLSDAVPALENFGFRVIKEIPIALEEGALGTIHEFTVDLPEGDVAAQLLERAGAIEAAIAEVLNGGAEDDPFNRLVVSTGLAAQETEWLRAIYRYLRQTGMSFTIYTVVDALGRAPDVTRAMIDLFVAKHHPEFAGARDEAVKGAISAYDRGLSKVAAINDDRLLRLYRAVIDAVLRTNAFAPAAAEALAFKIDSDLVPNLPKPVPWREIFVYSRRVEGIHLRSGAIARGGLRWSDRRDDFRTEILGLMKAQRVKNAVIVPTGAKGGFYPKQLPSPALDREGWAAEGQASYEVFIRTLLSVTDNIVDGTVVHPEKVAIHDGEDPYFVVAADKGTARFSDVANGIAESRDFWLDDAFASGGSNGYDHKAMGITARGAWVSVQRHFLEMGIDVQKDSVSVAGCGDMSGDVFGNGMLLSKAIKLVAAFDHRHIFIDPDPDPATSWKERKRLYDLPRSSWEDYKADLISKGGGVYSRDLKRIKLSKKAREMLGIEEKEIEPDALVSAILKAELDLIWFGGIGTYIKAEQESHLAVGDPANDALRIDAAELRTKVIGEGANLGITQAGRIAFSMNGGRINTDFIDNSAGVDCSDNEVNIKIALAAAAREGTLTEKKRNNLLAKMTDEVADIVLEDNRLQALAISVAEAAGAEATASYIRLIEQLEEIGDLDRRTEGLADGEAFARRAADGKGLTRPELAVLLSSSKLALQDAIEASGLPDDPMLEDSLIALFPEPMRKSFTAQIKDHRLRRELVATDLSNRIVNRLGLVHAFELAEEEGVGLSDVAAAFVVVERLYDLGTLWEELETAKMSEAARLVLFDRAAAAVGNLMSDVLRTAAGQVQAGELVATLRDCVDILTKARTELLSDETRVRSEELRRYFIDSGCPDALALKVSNLFDYDGSIGLAQLALKTEIDPKELTHAFTDIGERIGLDWAQGTAAHMSPSDIWERLLVDGLARDFQHMRLEFLRRLMRRKGGKDDPQGAIADWAARNAAAVSQFRSMIARAQARPPVAPAVLAQIASQARNLLER